MKNFRERTMSFKIKKIPFIFLFILMSCQNQEAEKNRKMSRQESINPVDGSNIEGHYQAKFTTLNSHINGTIPGSANLFRIKDRLFAYVRLFGGGVNAWHIQNIYIGTKCPTLSDDLNQDGFIDIDEAEKVLGKIIIPLDNNIKTQKAGEKRYPYADLSGNYAYERVTSFSDFLKDLNREDENLLDNVIKISKQSGFDFKNLTVLIQGVEEGKDLPDTVTTKAPHESYQTIPITCGTFEKILKVPGEVYDENEIPGPIEESEDESEGTNTN
jgi:hypothetical protein